MLKRRARECITRCKWNYMRRACRPCPAFRPQTGRIIKMGVAFSSLPILLLIRQPSGVGLSMLALPQVPGWKERNNCDKNSTVSCVLAAWLSPRVLKQDWEQHECLRFPGDETEACLEPDVLEGYSLRLPKRGQGLADCYWFYTHLPAIS